MTPGFPETIQQLSEKMRERRLYGATLDALRDQTTESDRVRAEREGRWIDVAAWIVAAIILGSIVGLSALLLPTDWILGFAICLLVSAAILGIILFYDSQRYPSGGRL